MRPAQCLTGRTLNNGWTVEKLVPHSGPATGGHFSTSYVVRSATGHQAFLKAMDFTAALYADDPAKHLEILASAYNFERRLLERCAGGRLSRIVGVLDAGTIRIEPDNPNTTVQYLIFELALRDVRSCIGTPVVRDVSWILRLMHDAAAAVRQLHSVQIAHQDIKPSNVLLFPTSHAKLADLGRASAQNLPSVSDELKVAGDRSYAPPELLYGHLIHDWRHRRLGSDLYLLGSLFVVLLMGMPMTHILMTRLLEEHHHSKWRGSYAEVLPYINSAFAGVLRDIRCQITSSRTDRFVRIIRELCDPNPATRGSPKAYAQGTDPYALDRYIAMLDLLYRTSEIEARV